MISIFLKGDTRELAFSATRGHSEKAASQKEGSPETSFTNTLLGFSVGGRSECSEPQNPQETMAVLPLEEERNG